MNIEPPVTTAIEASVASSRNMLRRRIGRRRTLGRAGIGAGALVVVGIAGAGAATAFFPHYYDLEGTVKTAYAEEFVDCVRDAGWDARIVSGAEGAALLGSFGMDPATNSVVTHHLLADTQGESGRAITTCQEDIAADVGEAITSIPE